MATDAQQPSRPLDAIILAAGRGTRMGSELPKVLHPVAGRPMVDWVLDACEAVGVQRKIIVVGHGADWVRKSLADRKGCEFVEQTPQLGTGHAVMRAEPLYLKPEPRLVESPKRMATRTLNPDLDVLVLCGDGPLIRPQTLRTLVDTHRTTGAAVTLATAVLEDAKGYGRIVRDGAGRFQRIVEEKDATESERAIREINPSYYCFRSADLFRALHRIRNDNAKGEYYLTDVLGLLIEARETVSVVEAVPAEDVLSINTPGELAEVDQILRQRVAELGTRNPPFGPELTAEGELGTEGSDRSAFRVPRSALPQAFRGAAT